MSSLRKKIYRNENRMKSKLADQKKNSKCNKCEWATWHSLTSVYCPFGEKSCFKEKMKS